jgi:hypothetical protein
MTENKSQTSQKEKTEQKKYDKEVRMIIATVTNVKPAKYSGT